MVACPGDSTGRAHDAENATYFVPEEKGFSAMWRPRISNFSAPTAVADVDQEYASLYHCFSRTWATTQRVHSFPFTSHATRLNTEADTHFSKLFSIYISEAEKYDKTLVDGWRSDMEGMLIFAGLFSAVLTAFITQSYQNLSPDNAAMTVELLLQISAQMAGGGALNATTTGTTISSATLSAFTPARSSLACNMLWFMSLGLSLGCALLATLVEQWARNFVQRVDMRPSPPIRARMYSFLYFGLKRFRMHDIVEVVPLLLHLSLILFLAGLVLFLIPVNTAVMFLCVGILGLIMLVYATVTVLPLLASDCPYRTPLTNACWNLAFLGRHIVELFHPNAVAPTQTMTERMVVDATAAISPRFKRDLHALTWTLKSRVDDAELAPFIEALPEALFVTAGDVRSPLIVSVTQDTEAGLVRRLLSFLRSAVAGNETQRCIAAVKAVVALAHIRIGAGGATNSFQPSLPFFAWARFEPEHGMGQASPVLISGGLGWSYLYTDHPGAALEPYWSTMSALLYWSCACEIEHSLDDLQRAYARQGQKGNIEGLVQSKWRAFGRPGYPLPLPSVVAALVNDTVPVSDLLQTARAELADAKLNIVCTYLLRSLDQPALPYRFESSFAMLWQSFRPPFSAQHQEMVAKTLVTWKDENWKFSEAERGLLNPAIQFLVHAYLSLYSSYEATSPLTTSSIAVVDALLSFIGRHNASERAPVIETVLGFSALAGSMLDTLMDLVTRYINENPHFHKASERNLTGLWALAAWILSSRPPTVLLGDTQSIARLDSLKDPSGMATCASVSITINHLRRLRSELDMCKDSHSLDVVQALYDRNWDLSLWPDGTAAPQVQGLDLHQLSSAERHRLLSTHLRIRLNEATLAGLAGFINASALHLIPHDSSLVMRLFAENLSPGDETGAHARHRMALVDALIFFTASHKAENCLVSFTHRHLDAFLVFLDDEDVMVQFEARLRARSTGHATKELAVILGGLRGLAEADMRTRIWGTAV